MNFSKLTKQYVLPNDKPKHESLLILIEQTKPYRDLFLNYCETLIYLSIPISESVSSLFEILYNDLHYIDSKNIKFYDYEDIELYDFMMQELLYA